MRKTNPPELSIIIVSFNVRNFLKKLLESLFYKLRGEDFEIIVIDNGSCDGTPKMIEKEFPKVKLITNIQNFGFAKANNQGLKISKGKYILFLNPDTLIIDNSIPKMINFLKKNPKVGLIGPEQLNKNGRLRLTISRNSPLLFLDFILKKFFNLSLYPQRKVLKTTVISGAAMMVRKNLLDEMEGFSEKNFLYKEEYDLCKKIKNMGFEIYLLTDCKIVHYKGQSTKKFLPFWKRLFH